AGGRPPRAAAGRGGGSAPAPPVRVLPARGSDPQHRPMLCPGGMEFGQVRHSAPAGLGPSAGMSTIDVPSRARPLLEEPVPRSAMAVLAVGVVVPVLALMAAGPVPGGWGLARVVP